MNRWNTKEMMQRHLRCALSTLCLIGIIGIGGCGAKKTEDTSAAQGSLETNTPKITSPEEANEAIDNFQTKIGEMRDNDVIIVSGDTETIDGVTLNISIEDNQERLTEWEGYSEQELGILSPDKMPNCQQDETGIHYIMFNDIMYLYVNDLNERGMTDAGLKEYANIWVNIGEKGVITILGNAEQYGKSCAKEGEVTE